jgi:membrane protease YdiL (CAAX protease family)
MSAVSTADRLRAPVAAYTTAIACAVAVESELNASVGAALCGVLVVALLNHHIASLGGESDHRGIFLALALIPLTGVLAVVMPLELLVPAAWPLLVAAPALLAVGLAARTLGLRRAAVGLSAKAPLRQLGIALLGVPLGWLAYVGLRPAVLDGGALGLAAASLALLAFTEELLFRGLLQPTLCRLYGGAGIVSTAMLSAAVALGAHSLAYGVFAGLVAAGFGLAAQRTGSILGTSLARALMFIGLLIVWPLALG